MRGRIWSKVDFFSKMWTFFQGEVANWPFLTKTPYFLTKTPYLFPLASLTKSIFWDRFGIWKAATPPLPPIPGYRPDTNQLLQLPPCQVDRKVWLAVFFTDRKTKQDSWFENRLVIQIALVYEEDREPLCFSWFFKMSFQPRFFLYES